MSVRPCLLAKSKPGPYISLHPIHGLASRPHSVRSEGKKAVEWFPLGLHAALHLRNRSTRLPVLVCFSAISGGDLTMLRSVDSKMLAGGVSSGW